MASFKEGWATKRDSGLLVCPGMWAQLSYFCTRKSMNLSIFEAGIVVRDGRWHFPLQFTLKNANLFHFNVKRKNRPNREKRTNDRGGSMWWQQWPASVRDGKEPVQV